MVDINVWVVAYINRDNLGSVEKDLKKGKFNNIKVYIPTVRLLKKKFKGKNIYEEVPLLFNYGFFSIPYRDACNEDYLYNLRKKVPCIHAWVKDTQVLYRGDLSLNVGNKTLRLPKVAVVKESEIVQLVKAAENMSIFSDDIVDKLEPGNFIILQGYPYENIQAEIVKVYKDRKEVKVKLLLETMLHEIIVSFDNVFYTVYSNFNEDLQKDSLDAMDSHGKRVLDKLYAKVFYDE